MSVIGFKLTLIGVVAAGLVALLSGHAAATSQAGTVDSIVFVRNADLYVRAGGGAVRRLTNTRAAEAFPSWSPNRREVVYVRNGDIWVMRADGTSARRLRGGSAADNRYPTWSPDGRLIAFAGNRAGGENELYVMNRDGTKLRRLTRTARWIDDTQPRFSPDGRFIVFTSNRPSFFNYEIYRIRAADGGGLKRLTFWGSGEDGAPGDDLAPVYNPHGTMIAFTSDRSGDTAVWWMDADGKSPREAARHPGQDAVAPRFSPRGSSLVYAVLDADGTSRLWTVRLDGANRSYLVPGTEADWGTDNLTVTQRSISGAPLGLERADYLNALPGKSRLDRIDKDLNRLVFPDLRMDVYLEAGKGTALLTYDRRFSTKAPGVGPCSKIGPFWHLYMRQVRAAGPVTLYRFGNIVFRVVNDRVGAIAVGATDLAVQAAANSIDCVQGEQP